MSIESFHPLIQRWFSARFCEPTDAQRRGWPAILQGEDTLIAAPTGSGKTLTAFLASIDRLLRLAVAGQLRDQTYVVYVSPLRALSNDIQRNLQVPLAEILELAREEYPACPEIRALVRTGDTPAHERQRMVRKPPHMLVTTPESLYLVLTGLRSRQILRHVDTVVVDEIHAIARDKRGAHLSLSLERLDALCMSPPTEPPLLWTEAKRRRPVRIGLSATQKPLDELARFLTGTQREDQSADRGKPTVVNIGHFRDMDLAVEVPDQELQAVCTHEHWAEVYARLVRLIEEHRSTLIFVNTRKLAERVAHQLSERLGEEAVLSHHGSLAHRSRQRTEQRLKDGSLRAVVATASLELGIDIGHIDLVCQLGTPRSIATFLQRIGRAGHSLGALPKGRLFALSREELIECLALVRAAREGRLDRVEIPETPLDILAQQIVAAVACEDWNEDQLYELCRRAYPYRNLTRQDYEDVLNMLSEGLAPQRGRYGAHLHRDRVNRRLHARKGARLIAITCGGAIPEIADYRVVTDDENRTLVGTLDEDFAIESNGGDIFLLGNTSWRVKWVRGGEVVVSDAHGAPPTIPFWRGEAPGRTFELSTEVGDLREHLVNRMNGVGNQQHAVDWLVDVSQVSQFGAEQAATYVSAQHTATGMVPTQKKLLFERFFDESGGMQLVVHAPFGTRINRAWGLALRKRFCRSFDFELQAAAGDNGVVLSLGAQHSFPLEQMFHLVPSHLVRDVLVQAFLAVPFFGTRWRWNVTRALQMKRADKGKRVPPHLQRMRADDLLSAVFPAQTACQENVVGDIEIPSNPMVQQTVHDCLNEAADIAGLLSVLRGIESGEIETVGLDSREPSPFAHELLNAMPYAFLDDAPLEERRTRTVTMRRSLPAEALRDLGRLDPAVIAQVRTDAWPLVRDADELHDVLLSHGALPERDGSKWTAEFDHLVSTGRAMVILRSDGPPLWAATERLPLTHAIWPDAEARPAVSVPAGVRTEWEREEAITHLVRGRIECIGPVTASALADAFRLRPLDMEAALASLEMQGIVMRGQFTGVPELEWCERRLLARVHRLTLEGLRRQIAPVSPEQFVRFLVQFQHLDSRTRLRGQSGLLTVVEQLEGYEAPAGHWEKYILPKRLEDYDPAWLDSLTFFGQAGWGRLRPPSSASPKATGTNGKPMKAMTRSTPIALMLRDHLAWLPPPTPDTSADLLARNMSLGGNARAAYEAFVKHGALFPIQLGTLLNLVPAQVDDVLGELAAAGLLTSDGYPALRALVGVRGQQRFRRRLPGYARKPPTPVGRWTLLRSTLTPDAPPDVRVAQWCRLLLRRYGVVFRDVLANEAAAPPWYELVRCYRRLEGRGEIRGGRFVAGVAGEQYALPEAIALLRSANEVQDEKSLFLPATDPLNFTGRLFPGSRVPALPGNWVVIKNGAMEAAERRLRARFEQM